MDDVGAEGNDHELPGDDVISDNGIKMFGDWHGYVEDVILLFRL